MLIVLLIITISVLEGVPVALTGLNIYNIFAKKKWKPDLVDTLVFTLGPICTLILYLAWKPLGWQEVIHLGGDEFPFHEPISNYPAILILAGIVILGYALLRIKRFSLPPLAIVLCIACMYIGCALSVVWIAQLSPNLGRANLYLPMEGYLMCLFPFNFVISTISLIRMTISERKCVTRNQKPKNSFLVWCANMLDRSYTWPIVAFILMWPILGFIIMILVLLGQQPDSMIKAFTETSDWLLSQKVSPPTVYYDSHYLCTVAAGGHRRLVKPLRMGVRRGNPIIVNRQLCIANAFEELISDKMPRFHRLLRHVYDICGYPVSKHIKTSLAADITYLVMKPLEWLFLLVLYLFDREPENRIARQYLPI